jgi:ABC-type multidrug transport system ATPase subunit/fucose 4-O-acetylase-like acetyltransferase
MTTQTKERIHALDTVRAFALLSGIVLHATMTFMPGLAAFGFPADSSQSPALQVVFYVIHVFRMALFFMLAGYFSHLIFHRKGAAGFIRDRVKRIAVPMLIGWVFFGPLAMAMVYIGFAPSVPGAAAPPAPNGFPLAHLWFLYYLLLFYVATLAIRNCFVKLLDRDGRHRAHVDSWMRSLVNGYAAPVVLAAPIAACLYLTPNWIMWSGIASPDTGFTPQLPAMIGFGTAFGFGWLLHRQSDFLNVWKQRWIMHLTLAAAFTALSLWIVGRETNPFAVAPAIKLAYAASYTFAIWNWVFGLTGAALRFFSGESAVRRYIADSSYWVYLAHLPVVFGLQMIVLKWNLHWGIKFPLIIGAALALLLLSYHYLVRNTYIGEILNGRRHKHADATPDRTTSQTDGPVIAELSGVRKRYGTTVALDGVDLQIRSGELLAFLGPNGAGKSTAISCLLGLQDPDSGTVTVLGGSPHAIESRRHVGAMLQNVELPAELRVHELIDLSCSYYAAPMPVDEVMRLTFTASIANRPYAKLSGGQKRLVQFAIALCGRPKLLFLDEPTVGLDLQARQMLWATLRRLVSEGCSIVLTTHYLEEAEALADRVAVLAKGKLVALGSVQEVRERVSSTRISCVTRLDIELVSRWPGVISASRDGARLNLQAKDADKVVQRLSQEDPEFNGLKIDRPGLAEAFTDITQEAA